MQRPWQVHLVAQCALTGLTMFVLTVLGDALTPATRMTVMAVVIGYVTISILLLSFRYFGASGAVARVIDRILNSGGGVVSVIAFWIVAPYSSLGLLLVMVIFLVGTVMLQVAGAVQTPPSKPSASLTTLFLPGAIGLYFALHWQWASWSMIPFAITYGFMGWVFHRRLQRAVDDAYAARLESEAATAQVAAERDARTKFLESTSHDLTQPLQSAQAALDEMARDTDPETRAAAVRRAARALSSIDRVVRQVPEHLALQAGRTKAQITEVAIGRLIAQVAEKNAASARLVGVTITPRPSRMWVWGDPLLLTQALDHLVGDAIRRSENGRVLVGARRAGDRVRIWVLDEGSDAAEADLALLSRSFAPASEAGGATVDGFSLGLSSARRLAHLMDGTLGFQRRGARGGAFWLELARDLPGSPKPVSAQA